MPKGTQLAQERRSRNSQGRSLARGSNLQWFSRFGDPRENGVFENAGFENTCDKLMEDGHVSPLSPTTRHLEPWVSVTCVGHTHHRI